MQNKKYFGGKINFSGGRNPVIPRQISFREKNLLHGTLLGDATLSYLCGLLAFPNNNLKHFCLVACKLGPSR
jgi:hypothetical protein